MRASVSVGRARRVLDRAGYGVWEVSIPGASGALAVHRHDRAQLHLVLEGEYSESARGRDHALGPGSVLFRPAALGLMAATVAGGFVRAFWERRRADP